MSNNKATVSPDRGMSKAPEFIDKIKSLKTPWKIRVQMMRALKYNFAKKNIPKLDLKKYCDVKDVITLMEYQRERHIIDMKFLKCVLGSRGNVGIKAVYNEFKKDNDYYLNTGEIFQSFYPGEKNLLT